MKISAAEYIARTFRKAGINHIFGIPSYVGMTLLDSFAIEEFQIMLNSHEQNAVHAAEGYYFATGKIPLVSIAVGPGVTNSITGIANAYAESIPMIIIAGRPSTGTIGRNEYHANSGLGRTLDERMLLSSCTKQVYYIDNIKQVEYMITDAIRTAISGRPGPVYISVPAEIQKDTIIVNKIPTTNEYIPKAACDCDNEDLRTVEKYFNNSQKPIIIFGNQIMGASIKDIEKLVKNSCPYFTSYNAKGKVPLLPNYMGSVWYSNSRQISEMYDDSDLVLAVGEDFTAFTSRIFKEHKNLIQINENDEEIGRVFKVKLGIKCNVADFISKLKLQKKPRKINLRSKISSITLDYLHQIAQCTPNNSVFMADVGNAGYAAITDLNLKNDDDFYTTGKFGVCGWSTAASIGYSLGDPNKIVFTIVGDLSFNMNIQELMNVKTLNTKCNFIVFNNNTLQNIEQDQLDEIKKSVQIDMPNINYNDLASGYKMKYIQINSIVELPAFFASTDFNSENYIIEIKIPREDRPVAE